MDVLTCWLLFLLNRSSLVHFHIYPNLSSFDSLLQVGNYVELLHRFLVDYLTIGVLIKCRIAYFDEVGLLLYIKRVTFVFLSVTYTLLTNQIKCFVSVLPTYQHPP